jgi:cation:H+ antiporter
VGSNIFNVLLVIGLSAVVSPIHVTVEARSFDIPVMIAVAAACLPIFFTGWRIDRLEGLFFLGSYVAYLVYLYLSATGHAASRTFGVVMLAFVLPICTVVLAANALRALLKRRAAPDEPP